MAERRMFALKIIDSDAFLDMPKSSQALYFHLSMRADDDGFISNPKKIMRMIGSSDDDMKILMAKRFLLSFDTGIVVIKHWRLHNYIAKDRYNETIYKEEKDKLFIKANGSYTDHPEVVAIPYTGCIQDDDTGKVSIGKVSKIDNNEDETPDKPASDTKQIKPKKENRHKEIYDVYILAYENMFGIKPLINYPSVSKLITKHLQSITKEQIIDAINVAKTDDFCSKKTPFELATILSNNVIMRLVNESRIQNSSSLPKTNTAPAAEVTCCGQKYSHEIGFCKVCGKSYNRDGSER